MLHEIERFTGQRIKPMRMPTAADVAARRMQLFKDSMRKTLAEEDLELYLALVEELAEEAGSTWRRSPPPPPASRAATSRSTSRPCPRRRAAAGADGRMVRLFLDAGREAGIRPGRHRRRHRQRGGHSRASVIGAIDIHERFTFVELPAEYVDRVLERMRDVQIRGEPIVVKLATPRDDSTDRRGGPPKHGKARPPQAPERPTRRLSVHRRRLARRRAPYR